MRFALRSTKTVTVTALASAQTALRQVGWFVSSTDASGFTAPANSTVQVYTKSAPRSICSSHRSRRHIHDADADLPVRRNWDQRRDCGALQGSWQLNHVRLISASAKLTRAVLHSLKPVTSPGGQLTFSPTSITWTTATPLSQAITITATATAVTARRQIAWRVSGTDVNGHIIPANTTVQLYARGSLRSVSCESHARLRCSGSFTSNAPTCLYQGQTSPSAIFSISALPVSGITLTPQGAFLLCACSAH